MVIRIWYYSWICFTKNAELKGRYAFHPLFQLLHEKRLSENDVGCIIRHFLIEMQLPLQYIIMRILYLNRTSFSVFCGTGNKGLFPCILCFYKISVGTFPICLNRFWWIFVYCIFSQVNNPFNGVDSWSSSAEIIVINI